MNAERRRGASSSTFRFRSPGPGAYRIQLVGEEASNVASLLLSGAEDEAAVDLEPGPYVAIIEPIGSNRSMRQVLELSSGRRESVQLEDAFFTQDTPPPEIDAMFSNGGVASYVQFKRSPIFPEKPLGEAVIPAPGQPRSADRPSVEPREFSIGLSARDRRSDRWQRGSLPVSVNDEPGGGAVILLRRPRQWAQLPEWRLTAAVASDRRWRMRVPLFKGGVQLLLQPSQTAAGLDLAVSVAPRNAGRAALVANLEQMILESSTEAIRSSLPGIPRSLEASSLIDHLLRDDEDPWTILAAALLLVRTDEIGSSPELLEHVVKKWAFIPDMGVLRAWIAAREKRDRIDAERRCLRHLRAISGHPYYAASQGLGLELLTALSVGGSNSTIRRSATSERERWARVRRRQLSTGAFLSWEDARSAAATTLDRKAYSTIAEGTIEPGKVDLHLIAEPEPEESGIPALKRPQVVDDDPWKERFGNQPERSGYRLAADFRRGPEGWVEVDLSVHASPGEQVRQVELFLHDSFYPNRVKVDFVNGVARHSLLAWGGFTVGAWVPKPRVELELDLAKVLGAPYAIRKI